MSDGEIKTLADAIRCHVDCQQTNERLTARLFENDRKTAEVYKMIREALSRPEMSQFAVMDDATRRVYVMGPNGMVCDFVLRSADDVVMGGDDCAVSVGEAS